MRIISLALVGLGLAACSGEEATGTAAALSDEQTTFFENLTAICGTAYEGALVSNDLADADMADQTMVMHVRECSDEVIRIAFFVGEDRSRTWVVSKTDSGLRLKHDHRHEDGSEDRLTQYGGDTADAGSPNRQTFPADAFSKTMFTREGISVSNANIWAIDVDPGKTYAYEMSRPERFFRVEFDLSRPLAEAPAPPWGAD